MAYREYVPPIVDGVTMNTMALASVGQTDGMRRRG